MLSLAVVRAFVKEASAQLGDLDTPDDYYETRARVAAKLGHVKTAFDWHGFKEGIVDEGIPLGGATIGAALGGMRGSPLRGAALGYAAGGGLSLLRSKLKGEEPSMSQKLLAAGALGYGAGGLTHSVLSNVPRLAKTRAFSGHGFVPSLVEEALPAAGATLGTGIAMGMNKKPAQHG